MGLGLMLSRLVYYGKCQTKRPTSQWWQVKRPDNSLAWISGTLIEQLGPVDEVSLVTGIPTPARRASGFVYGLHANLYQSLDRTVAATKDVGFGWLALQVAWADVERAQGSIDWGYLDGIIGSASTSGLKFMLIVTKAPAWARPAGAPPSDGPPEDMNAYASFVGQLAARYCGKVGAIQVWQDPNLTFNWGGQPPDAAQYMAMLKLAYQAIKGNCPGTIVISGAPMPTGGGLPVAVDDVTYLDQMFRNGLSSACDAVGARLLGYNNPPDARLGYSDPAEPDYKGFRSFFFRDTLEAYRQVMTANGDGKKPIWVTEFGWPTGVTAEPYYDYTADNTPEEQTAYTVRAYEIGRESGYIGAMFLWNLNWSTTAPESSMALWSIVSKDWEPTATYTALKNMPK